MRKVYRKIIRAVSVICCVFLCLSICASVQVGASAEVLAFAKDADAEIVEKQFFPVEGDKEKYFTYFISEDSSKDKHALFITGLSEKFGNSLDVPESIDGVKINDLFLCRADMLEEVKLADVTENIFCVSPERWLDGTETNYPTPKNMIKKLTVGREFRPECLFLDENDFLINDLDACPMAETIVYTGYGKDLEAKDYHIYWITMPFDNLIEVVAPEEAQFISTVDSTVIYSKGYKKLIGVLPKASKEMTGITVHEDCVEIAESAFWGIKTLEKLILGERVETIGAFAFYNCKNLTTVEFNDKLKFIGDSAFESTSMEKIIFSEEAPTVFGENVFSGCRKLKSVQLPANIARISEGMFSGCKALENIDIPKAVKVIEDAGFYECKSLKKVVLPKRIKSIGKYAFKYCKSLKKVVIPQSTKTIRCQAFASCGNLKKIIVKGKKTRLKKDCIGYKAVFSDPAKSIKSKTTIVAPKGSLAEKYAKKNGVKFKVLK